MSRLQRVTLSTAGAAIAAAAGVMVLAPAHASVESGWMILGLWLASFLGEIAYVRVRHGEATEDLTLFEAVVVVGAFLLSPTLAILVPITALAAASAVLRRGWLKSCFNLGSYTLATSVLVGVLSLVEAPTTFGPLTLAAAVVGGLGFAGMNLVALSRVLSVVEEVPAREILRSEWKLSALMAVANIAIGCMAVSLGRHDPVLLVCLALPVLTLTYAYRSAAARATAEQRNHILLELAAGMGRASSREELVEMLRAGVSAAFRADEVRLVLADEDAEEDGTRAEMLAACAGGAAAFGPGMVRGWRSGVVAPVRGNEEFLGAIGVGLRERTSSSAWKRLNEREHAALGSGEVPVLASLAAALGAALAASAHLRAVAEESRKLQVVVDGAQEGILVLEAGGRVLVWNEALAASTGVPSSEAEGMMLAELLGASGEGLLRAIASLSPERPTASSELHLSHEGALRELLASISSVAEEEGGVHRVVVMFHDVTLERRVGRLKDDFIATISHELRTPITPIKGYAELLLRKSDRIPPEKRTKMLSSILERTDHLARLVEDLLLSSRIASGGAHAGDVACVPVELAGVLESSIADFPGLAGRVSCEGAAGVWVSGDATRIRQVVGNLLSNAMKYSPPESPVEVRVRVVEARLVEVSVTDHGRGIPTAEQAKVFEKFHRVEDSRRMSTGGSGLGLFIASELAAAMGGSLHLESEVGAGSTFTLSLASVSAPSVGGGPSGPLQIPSQVTIEALGSPA